MKRSSLAVKVLLAAVIIAPVIYLFIVYTKLPERVPVHFDIEGNPNGFADRSSLWFFVLLLSGLATGMYLLFKNLPKIDPKKTAGQSPELFNKIAVVMVLIVSAVNAMLVYAATGSPMNMSHFMLPLLGFIFAVLGNYMHSIKPNYFIGFRLPWTLESEDNWRKTHQLVARLWVPGGIMIAIASLLLPPKQGYIFFLTMLFFMVVIPAGFSYRYFRKQQQS